MTVSILPVARPGVSEYSTGVNTTSTIQVYAGPGCYLAQAPTDHYVMRCTRDCTLLVDMKRPLFSKR